MADRHYMRDEYHPPRAVTILIVVLIVAFVIQSLLVFYGSIQLTVPFALTASGVLSGKVWQLLTFQFLHAAPWPWHVLMNCLGLYFFGRSVETMLGSKKFLILYFLSGVAGGLVQVITTILLPRHMDIPVVGASAGVCGMIAIFCSLQPMQELTTWIYFFPVHIRARTFLIFLTLLSLFGTIIPFDYVAHGAHLGGILVGIVYVRWGETIQDRFARKWPFKRRKRTTLSNVPGNKARQSSAERGASDVFLSIEVDAILDKISAQGIQSLTDAERKVLEAARKKMGK